MKPNEPLDPDDLDAPETYGPMNELRFQILYWVDDKQIQNYQDEHGYEAVVLASGFCKILADLKQAGIIKSWAVRIDDNRGEHSTFIRMEGMHIDTYEKLLEDFKADHPECDERWPESQ